MDRWRSIDSPTAGRLRTTVADERSRIRLGGVRRRGIGSHRAIGIGILEMRIEDLLVVGRERKALTFVESDDEDTGLHEVHRGGDERFGGAFYTSKSISNSCPKHLCVQDKVMRWEIRTDSIGTGVRDGRSRRRVLIGITLDGGRGGRPREGLGQRRKVSFLKLCRREEQEVSTSSGNHSCASREERPTKHTFGELPRHFDGGYLRGRRPGARKRGNNEDL